MLINLLPNTAETVGIINSARLAQLPDNSYVLNLARGVHVVEEDLLAALDSGKLKGRCWMCSAANRCRKGARFGGTREWR